MIDSLISDLMKQIRINLELHFKSSEFSNFYELFLNFYKFIWISFQLKRIKYHIYITC